MRDGLRRAQERLYLGEPLATDHVHERQKLGRYPSLGGRGRGSPSGRKRRSRSRGRGSTPLSSWQSRGEGCALLVGDAEAEGEARESDEAGAARHDP
jgi:hypothetical protein